MPLHREKTYQVISPRAVAVDFPNGDAVSYPHGYRFKASPSNRCVIRLLRNNSIRELSPSELKQLGA